MLNLIIWGITTKKWRYKNSYLGSQNKNIRYTESLNELIVLSNLESINAIFIRHNMSKEDRYIQLKEIAKVELRTLETKHKKNNLTKINSNKELKE
jgi:hypothetical protein